MNRVSNLFECRECGTLTTQDNGSCPSCNYAGSEETEEVNTLQGRQTVKKPWFNPVELTGAVLRPANHRTMGGY